MVAWISTKTLADFQLKSRMWKFGWICRIHLSSGDVYSN